MLAIISKRKYFYFISGTLVTLSLIALFVWGLKFGIDFTGGTQMEVEFTKQVPDKNDLQKVLTPFKLNGLIMQVIDNKGITLKYKNSDDKINVQVFKAIQKKYPDAKRKSVDFIGSSVSDQLKKNAIEAIILAIIGIALYITWAFRKVSRPVKSWKYGIGAIIALSHDVIITIGFFVLFGQYFGVEVGVPFITALLTILGYSVNDTIVVYDRIRENLTKASAKEDFEKVVNRSLNETLARSINTSFTVIIVLLAVIFLGEASIKFFAIALLIGVVFGTYSSIYIASALMVTSYKYQIKAK